MLDFRLPCLRIVSIETLVSPRAYLVTEVMQRTEVSYK
jgi:hypothetical protein